MSKFLSYLKNKISQILFFVYKFKILIDLNELSYRIQRNFGQFLQIINHFWAVTDVWIVWKFPANCNNLLVNQRCSKYNYWLKKSYTLSGLLGFCWQIVMEGNVVFISWKSVSKPVIVGLVWNFAHTLNIIQIKVIAATTTQTNHMNLERSILT